MSASSASDRWWCAGLASSFPDIKPAAKPKTKLRSTAEADKDLTQPCKILQPPSEEVNACELSLDDAQQTVGLEQQVLVFRYRGKLHAIDNSCPHRRYQLARGSLYDIEDFGIVLSAGIICPGHGWSFDLHTGQSDRGPYQLKVWETEVRLSAEGHEEVWVRSKT
ncbi:hypothetical protein EJ03DRAFT_330630 [Teratosphaeria nubilosa]|uniref:Rieske domain-containing protein n=1 Tax=Teratosphaeria nubilosa TaxID=161662 RepID=A0A6G1KZ26_9PEZI|nr:hypothetical protein EJ03DRAFT_330630 [Teratosphaeria nubilosa]